MPLMTKIRESMATVFAVFAGLFVIYIVLDWGMDITGRKHARQSSQEQEVGMINSKAIGYKEFSDLVRQTAENQKTQTGTEPDDEQMKMIRDQVWNQLVDRELYDEEIKQLGITVSDQEIIDWVKGDAPPDFLKRQFTDSTGVFNRQAYESAIQDPRNKDVWVRIEDALKQQRLQEKLQSVITASVKVSEGEISEKFADQNIRYDADYVFLDPNKLVQDKDLSLSDDDFHRYYNDHAEDYKVEASRKLKYVLFPDRPSNSDTTSVISDMEDITKRAKDGAGFNDLIKTYSETPASDTYFKHGELSQEKEALVFSAAAGDIIGPIYDNNGYDLIKVIDFRKGANDFVRASHILISIENNDSVKALKQAKDILASAKKGEHFDDLARKYSKDPGSGSKGGDLGWFGKGQMVKPFEEASFKAKPGQFVGPVRTQFGYHIIKVIAHDNREVKLADIRMTIKATAQTRNDINQRAQDFAYLAKQGNFEKEAIAEKYVIVQTQSFQKNAVIPGFGMNQPLNKFAFKGKVGDISEPISVQNGVGVFIISEAHENGVRPFDDVKDNVQLAVRTAKKIEKLKEMASELLKTIGPSDSLKSLKAKRPDLAFDHIGPFTVTTSIAGIGYDMKFMGKVSSLPVGNPATVEGTRGVYIVKLTNKSTFDSTAFNRQKETLRSQLLSDKRNRFLSAWSEQLKKSAEIVDNRDLFYKQ